MTLLKPGDTYQHMSLARSKTGNEFNSVHVLVLFDAGFNNVLL